LHRVKAGAMIHDFERNVLMTLRAEAQILKILKSKLGNYTLVPIFAVLFAE
jgi:hypothetical protein